MKTLRKISTILVAVTLLCAMSIVAVAAGTGNGNVLVENSGNSSEIIIKSAKAMFDESTNTYVLEMLCDFSEDTTVPENTRITVLGYLFGEVAEGTKAEDVDTPTAVTAGQMCVIEQTVLPTKGNNGYSIKVNLTQGEDDYTVTASSKLVVRLGSDAGSTKAQTFFIDLSNAKVLKTYKMGDIDNDGDSDASDWGMIFKHVVENETNENLVEGNWQFKAADLNEDGVLDTIDWMTLLNHVEGNSQCSAVGETFEY